MRILLILTMLLSSIGAFSQDLLLKQKTNDVLNDSDDYGPNKKKYNHAFMGFGFALPTNLDGEVNVHGGSSFSATYGFRHKRKLSNTFAIGYDGRFEFSQFRSKRDTNSVYTMAYGSIAPDSLKTDKLSYISLNVQPYLRVNLGQRGDHLGRYFDFAFYGEFLMNPAHTVKFNHPNDEVVGESHFKSKQIKYVNRFQYGPEFRFGNGFYNVYVRYRISDFFNNKLIARPNQLPAINAGIILIMPG